MTPGGSTGPSTQYLQDHSTTPGTHRRIDASIPWTITDPLGGHHRVRALPSTGPVPNPGPAYLPGTVRQTRDVGYQFQAFADLSSATGPQDPLPDQTPGRVTGTGWGRATVPVCPGCLGVITQDPGVVRSEVP